LGYNTKRIHSANIKGKYPRNAFLETFSEFSEPSLLAVVSVGLLVISFPTGKAQKPLIQAGRIKTNMIASHHNISPYPPYVSLLLSSADLTALW